VSAAQELPSRWRSENARELRYAATLSSVIALRMLGLFLILPVFMVLAADMPGFTPQSAGLAVGIYGLTQAALQQPFGWLSDRWGRRPVLLLGLFLFALGGVLAALAESMQALIAGRALQGCGAIAGVAMALAADVTRPQRRPLIMAVIGIGIGAAFLASMALSVPLALLLGLGGLFWLTVAFALAGIALVLTVPRSPPRVVEALGAAEGSPEFGSGPVWLLALSVFLLHAVMTLLFVTLPPMLVNEVGLGLPEHWKLYVPTMFVSVVLMLPILRRVGASLSEHRMLPWAFAALAVALGLLPLGGQWAGLAALITVYFLGFNLLEAGMPALLSRITGSRGRGRRMGLYSTFQFLGAFFGGVAGGGLLGSVGSAAALTGAGIVCLAWAVILSMLTKRFFLTGATF
jgi:predicted MFS family arabinose efflux permease